MRTIILCLAVLLAGAALLPSCLTASKFADRAELDPTKVPADFNPKKHILLVAEMPRRDNPEKANQLATRKLDEAFRENYPYRYQIVPLIEIYAPKGKYSDTSVYKFALLNKLEYRMVASTLPNRGGGQSQTRRTYVDFGFYDRSTKKSYPETGNASTRPDFIIAALVALIQTAKK